MRTALRPDPGNRTLQRQPLVLAAFRPTWRQAVVAALPAVGVVFILTLLGLAALQAWGAASGRRPEPGYLDGTAHLLGPAGAAPADGTGRVEATGWLAGLLPWPAAGFAVPVLVLVTFAVGMLLHRQTGVRIDETGIRGDSLGLPGFLPWRRVVAIRIERRRARTVIALLLRDGSRLRLPAPYHGPGLARDARLEWKYQLIRHLWDSYRDPYQPG